MDDLFYFMIGNHAPDKWRVGNVAHDEPRPGRNCASYARGKIVKHDHVLAGVDEGKYHVAADVAGSTSDKDGHGRISAIRTYLYGLAFVWFWRFRQLPTNEVTKR